MAVVEVAVVVVVLVLSDAETVVGAVAESLVLGGPVVSVDPSGAGSGFSTFSALDDALAVSSIVVLVAGTLLTGVVV